MTLRAKSSIETLNLIIVVQFALILSVSPQNVCGFHAYYHLAVNEALGKMTPLLHMKVVLAVVFSWQCGKITWQSVLAAGFATILCRLSRARAELKGRESWFLPLKNFRVANGNGKLADY